jgi:hypothetical protein
MNSSPSKVVQVGRIEFHPDSHVKKMYEKQKSSFIAQGKKGVSWVFRGTSVSNISKILNLGLKVGGSGGINIANGC